VLPVGRTSRRYFPVSHPPPSGDHGSRPSPFARHAGTISHSISRTSRLYGALHLPAGEVRQADVVDLSGAHGIVEEGERLLERSHGSYA
jgi:hypothetical protein